MRGLKRRRRELRCWVREDVEAGEEAVGSRLGMKTRRVCGMSWWARGPRWVLS